MNVAARLESTIRANREYIEKAKILDPETPEKWRETVDSVEEFLTLPESQGKNPGRALYMARTNESKVQFSTLHERRFTQIRPHRSQHNYIQWQEGDQAPRLQKREGKDSFPVYDVGVVERKSGEPVAVTLGKVPGKYSADTLLTPYVLQGNRWEGSRSVIKSPPLEERGVTRRGESLQFDRTKWDVTLGSETGEPVVALREKYRIDGGALQTPEQPTAFFQWDGQQWVWHCPEDDRQLQEEFETRLEGIEFDFAVDGFMVGDQFVETKT